MVRKVAIIGLKRKFFGFPVCVTWLQCCCWRSDSDTKGVGRKEGKEEKLSVDDQNPRIYKPPIMTELIRQPMTVHPWLQNSQSPDDKRNHSDRTIKQRCNRHNKFQQDTVFSMT